MKKIKKYYLGEFFIINEKDERLFEYARSENENSSQNVYFLIEELEFLRVEFDMLGW